MTDSWCFVTKSLCSESRRNPYYLQLHHHHQLTNGYPSHQQMRLTLIPLFLILFIMLPVFFVVISICFIFFQKMSTCENDIELYFFSNLTSFYYFPLQKIALICFSNLSFHTNMPICWSDEGLFVKQSSFCLDSLDLLTLISLVID